MAGKRKLCFYKAFATRQDQKLLRNRNPVSPPPFPVERKFRLEVSIWKKGRVMVISNTFPIFPRVFDHRAKPPRDLYKDGGCTNSVYEFL